MIDHLNLKIKHISILLSEIAKSAIPNLPYSSVKAEENINSKIMQRDFIFKLS